MSKNKVPIAILKKAKTITGRRAQVVVDHIIVNWLEKKDPAICSTCYWATPEGYDHVAMRPTRRLDVVWEGQEVADFDEIADAAKNQGMPMPDFVKRALRRGFRRDTQ